MGQTINLRGELAKLSDAELAERLKEAWRQYEDADMRQRSSSMFWRGRPTASLPLGYRIWAGLHRSPGFQLLDRVLRGYIASHTRADIEKLLLEKRLLVSDKAVEVDNHIEEIQMITSEIKRRVDRRKAST